MQVIVRFYLQRKERSRVDLIMFFTHSSSISFTLVDRREWIGNQVRSIMIDFRNIEFKTGRVLIILVVFHHGVFLSGSQMDTVLTRN